MVRPRSNSGGRTLGRLAAALALVLARPADAQAIGRWRAPIEEASKRFGIPQEWIRRVIAAESGGRTHVNGRPIASRSGAMGLMQLMPGTWAEMRLVHRLGSDPHDPRDNILAGTAYLRAMYDRFGYPGLFAAYNAGPARYARHLATGQRLPRETLSYVGAVAGLPLAARLSARAPATAPGLFASRAQAAALAQLVPPESAPPAASSSLFVPLTTAGH
jgi:soluble lytic murein transglycosylase-like protein